MKKHLMIFSCMLFAHYISAPYKPYRPLDQTTKQFYEDKLSVLRMNQKIIAQNPLINNITGALNNHEIFMKEIIQSIPRLSRDKKLLDEANEILQHERLWGKYLKIYQKYLALLAAAGIDHAEYPPIKISLEDLKKGAVMYLEKETPAASLLRELNRLLDGSNPSFNTWVYESQLYARILDILKKMDKSSIHYLLN